MSYDLALLDTKTKANEGFELEIIHPTTLEGTGLLITVLGEDSDINRKIVSAQAQKRLKRAVGRRGARSLNATDEDFEEAEDAELERLAALTCKVAMKDASTVLVDGKPLDATAAGYKTMYERYPVIRVQVEGAIRDRANFTQRSGSN